jgi:hypothetical protein
MTNRNAKISLKPGKSRAALTITHPNAAGIDIGSASYFVAVPPDRDDEPVREFPSFTVDLNALADWLKACGVDTVAMESTGVYWIPFFELLESRGFTVLLVNARHVGQGSSLPAPASGTKLSSACFATSRPIGGGDRWSAKKWWLI